MKLIAIVLRGCPAGWLGPYGNEWVVTPNLDRLAAEGVVFDRHYCERPALRVASRRNGVVVRANHPDTDGPADYYAGWGEVFDARPRPDDESPLQHLLEVLPTLPDSSFLCIETDALLPPWDVSQEVFAAYLDDPDDEEAHVSDVEYEGDEPAPEVVPEEAATPWFDPPPGPFDSADDTAREWLHTSFAAVVTKLDAELGEVFEMLREKGLDQSAAWVVTSDFGYPLGEHGHIGPHLPHEELVHLPLIVRLPGGAEAGRRIAAVTQPPDVPAAIESLMKGERIAGREFAVSACEHGTAIRTAEWALIKPSDGDAMLFEKPDDRWEVNDLRSRNVELADELEARLPQT